ncbi:basic salivary proline-rich protein 4-like [Aythya fuligula]|uniref:Basic salivary proline-rich protein 4-like n=1 Tax=Aythya fuligula TaxID=219594 RepID=A0A6J3D3H2_AYTFU|nr:basic salivary proline-rich protein 4-like [Aythya fuligula]
MTRASINTNPCSASTPRQRPGRGSRGEPQGRPRRLPTEPLGARGRQGAAALRRPHKGGGPPGAPPSPRTPTPPPGRTMPGPVAVPPAGDPRGAREASGQAARGGGAARGGRARTAPGHRRRARPPPLGVRQGREAAGQPPPPPGEQSAAWPRGLRRARDCGGGRAPARAPTHRAAALRGPGRAGGRRQGGRGAEPGPTRPLRPGSQRLAGPAAAPGEGRAAPTPPLPARRRRLAGAAPAPLQPPPVGRGAARPCLVLSLPPSFPPSEPLRGSRPGREPARSPTPPRQQTMRGRRPARGCRAPAPALRGRLRGLGTLR